MFDPFCLLLFVGALCWFWAFCFVGSASVCECVVWLFCGVFLCLLCWVFLPSVFCPVFVCVLCFSLCSWCLLSVLAPFALVSLCLALAVLVTLGFSCVSVSSSAFLFPASVSLFLRVLCCCIASLSFVLVFLAFAVFAAFLPPCLSCCLSFIFFLSFPTISCIILSLSISVFVSIFFHMCMSTFCFCTGCFCVACTSAGVSFFCIISLFSLSVFSAWVAPCIMILAHSVTFAVACLSVIVESSCYFVD